MARAKEFEDSLAGEDEKVWRITETDEGIIVHCNGVMVLNYTFTDADKTKACKDMWSEDTAVMKFHPQDSASDAYRPVRKIKKDKKKRKRAKGKRKGKKKHKGSKKTKDDEDTTTEMIDGDMKTSATGKYRKSFAWFWLRLFCSRNLSCESS